MYVSSVIPMYVPGVIPMYVPSMIPTYVPGVMYPMCVGLFMANEGLALAGNDQVKVFVVYRAFLKPASLSPTITI